VPACPLPALLNLQGDDDDDDDYEQDESATWAGTPGRVYSYAELAAATKGFSAGNKLGAGVSEGRGGGDGVALALVDTQSLREHVSHPPLFQTHPHANQAATALCSVACWTACLWR
jgi:hypothetical protein